MKELKGKNVLVTGGASGIGKLMGQLVLEKGAKLIIWDINSENIDQTISKFSHLGSVKAYKVDVADPEMVEATAALVKKGTGSC